MPLLVVAALFLTLADTAHVFTVEIAQPQADSLLAIDRSEPFEAVAYDSQLQDITSQVDWSWDFDDGSPEDTDNPTTHAFDATGDYTVTVTGALGGIEVQAIVEASVAPEWVADSSFYVRPAGASHLGYGGGLVFGSEVCDMIELVWETEEIEVHSARFFVCNPDGTTSWISGTLGPNIIQPPGEPPYEQAVSPEIMTSGWFPNQTKRYGVQVGQEYGTPNGPEWEYFDLEIEFTSNNTAVSSGDGVIVHTEGSAPHEIAWSIAHHDQCAVWDGQVWSWADPNFEVMVTIYDLTGNVQKVIDCRAAWGIGVGSTTWDGTVPGFDGPEDAPPGIYTYDVWAVHNQLAECCEQDKSPRLTITDVDMSDVVFESRSLKFRGTVGYTLSAAAASAELRLYDPLLQEVGSICVDPTVGAHDVTINFTVDPQPMGQFHFVISAVESDASARLNRVYDAKPALQKGATKTVLPRALNMFGRTEMSLGSSWETASNARDEQQHPATTTAYPTPPYSATCLGHAFTPVFSRLSSVDAQSEPNPKADAIFWYLGHADPGVLMPDSQTKLNPVKDKLYSGSGTNNPQDDLYYMGNMPAGSLDRCALVMLIGCSTAVDPDGAGGDPSMLDAFMQKGAACGVGTSTGVYAPAANVFSDNFWMSACSGGKTIAEAVADAILASGSPEQWWVLIGDSGQVLRPAAYN